MALADFFGRNATAVAQVLDRFEESGFRKKVARTKVGIGFGKDATTSTEGRLLLDLLVRLLARFYGSLALRTSPREDGYASELAALAFAINPRIEIIDGPVAAQIAVGKNAPAFEGLSIYAGSNGWDALISASKEQPLGPTSIPFGAGAAACLACANLFRALFVANGRRLVDDDLVFSTMNLDLEPTRGYDDLSKRQLKVDATLVGVGAVGNSVVWALSHLPFGGSVQLVDHQEVEVSNLQRYVLALHSDVQRTKVQVAREFLKNSVKGHVFATTWAQFVESQGYDRAQVLVAVDSATDRMAVQASLPQWIANAWTQPGDLGISVHSPMTSRGACLSCLYLPQAPTESQDEIVANALGVPERLMQIRELLYRGDAVPTDLLEAIASKLSVPIEKLLLFADRPVRELYVEGICGGAVLPLGQAGKPRQEVHVPVAHQSCLAGILLAGALVRKVICGPPSTTMISRIDVMRPLTGIITQPALKDPRGFCICEDEDFRRVYDSKYLKTNSRGNTANNSSFEKPVGEHANP